MDTVFMNSENSKTPEPHVLMIRVEKSWKYYSHFKSQYLLHIGKIKSSYNNNKFKIAGPTWNDKFELQGGSYSASDIQDNFEYFLKSMEKTLTTHQ